MTVHRGCGGPVIWCVDDTGICTRCHAPRLALVEIEQVAPPWIESPHDARTLPARKDR